MAGGNLMISNASSSGQNMVRGITLGFNTDFDPAAGMFNTTNFPGASSAQLDAARSRYAVLTGRVASVNSQAVLNAASGQYEELAPSTLEGGYKVFGMFAQDTWRLKPNLTVTGGLRYDIQTPFVPFTSVMSSVTMDSVCGRSGLGDGGLYSKCNFLSPGSLGRRRPAVHPARGGKPGLQDGPEQHRAVGQHRLAAGRAVRIPAEDPRRSGSGDDPRRILRGLRPPGAHAVHRPSMAATAAPRFR